MIHEIVILIELSNVFKIVMTGSRSLSEDRSSDRSSKNVHVRVFGIGVRDVLLVFSILAVIVVCLLTSLCGYFLLQATEIPIANDALIASTNISTLACSRALSSAMQNIMYPNSLYNTSADPLSVPYSAFVDMMYSNGGSFPPFIWSVSYCAYVSRDSIDPFSSLMREKGGTMSNFTVTGRDSLNRVIPIDRGYDHLIILWTVPVATDDKIRGYAITTDYAKNMTAVKAKETRKPAVSPVTILGNRDDLAIAVAMSTPVFNESTGAVVGSLNGAIVIGELISSAIAGIITDIHIILIDNSADAPNNGYMYSTEKYANGTTLSAVDARKSLSLSPFSTRSNISLADRVYTLVYYPTSRYLSRYERSDKIIALIVPLVLIPMFVTLCIITYIVLRLRETKRALVRRKETLDKMNDKQKSLQDMRNVSAKQVTKFRTIYENIPGYVLVLDSLCNITDMNSKFESDTSFTMKNIEQGLSISTVIPAISSTNIDTFIGKNSHLHVNTSSLGEIKVCVKVSTLNVQMLDTHNTSMSFNETLEDTYLIIAENTTAQ